MTMARFDDAELRFREVYAASAHRFGEKHWRTLQNLQDLARLERSRSFTEVLPGDENRQGEAS